MNRLFRTVVITVFLSLLAGTFSSCDQPSGEPVSAENTFEPILAGTADNTASTPDASGSLATVNPAFDPAASVELIPQPLADPNATVISIAWPGMDGRGPYSVNFMNHMTHLSGLLRKQGWNIRFTFDDVQTFDRNDRISMTQCLSEKMSAGSPLADGYIVLGWDAGEALESGYAMDLSQLVPKVAPVYYGRYRKLLEGQYAGLPMYLTDGHDRKITLMVKEEYAGRIADIETIGGLFRLLDEHKNWQIMGEQWYILDAWAFEQGYYPLSPFGVSGHLYAVYGDKECTPVLLEDIPGFNGFAGEYRRLVKDNQILDYQNRDKVFSSDTLIGYIDTLEPFTKAYNAYLQGICVAYPLAPRSPDSCDEYPRHTFEMMVSASSNKAEDIIRFVEWVNLNQENYDLMNYGELGADYRISGNRYEPLIDGKPVPLSQWNDAGAVNRFFTIGLSPFFNDRWARCHIYAPSNLEAVKGKYDDVVPSILELGVFRNPENYRGKMQAADADFDFSLLARSRDELLFRMFDPQEVANGKSLSDLLTKLSLFDNQQVVDRYKNIINEIRNIAGK